MASGTLSRNCPKARRDLSGSLLALYLFASSHVVVAKPLHTFARHALSLWFDRIVQRRSDYASAGNAPAAQILSEIRNLRVMLTASGYS